MSNSRWQIHMDLQRFWGSFYSNPIQNMIRNNFEVSLMWRVGARLCLNIDMEKSVSLCPDKKAVSFYSLYLYLVPIQYFMAQWYSVLVQGTHSIPIHMYKYGRLEMGIQTVSFSIVRIFACMLNSSATALLDWLTGRRCHNNPQFIFCRCCMCVLPFL